MNADLIMDLGHQAMIVAIKLSAPMLLITLVVGLIIAVFQAATQINEMTLSFVPKLMAMAILLMLMGSWMLQLLVEYTRELFRNIPNLIG
jgi:flagellar biosynthetic protein FliQ